jgi:hypothetical protein
LIHLPTLFISVNRKESLGIKSKISDFIDHA